MGVRDLSNLGKVMLVCSDPCHELENCFLTAGCWVLTVKDGETAVSRARRETFDAVVLVSTGKGMDLAETVFNLRDVNRSMQIIIVADQDCADPSLPLKEIAGHPPPNTRMFTVAELESQIAPVGISGRKRKKRKKLEQRSADK